MDGSNEGAKRGDLLAVTLLGFVPVLALLILLATSARESVALMVTTWPLITISPAYEAPSSADWLVNGFEESLLAVARLVILML